MKKYFYLIFAFVLLFTSCAQHRKGNPHILVFTKTAGYHHASIPDGVKAIQKMGKKYHFSVDTTSNAKMFTEDSLKKYAAVVFLNTTGDVLNNYQKADFKRYIQAGGGYVGVHAASDCEYHWPWYGQLVGAYFSSHPHQQKAKLLIHKDSRFPVTDSLPNPWVRKDEWYNFKEIPKNVNVLVSIDEDSYEGGDNGAEHPMVWYHQFDGGRSFYMALGHTAESYTDSDFLSLLRSGIKYAIGENEVLDYSKATALRVPDENRFSKKILVEDLDEPTEFTILPNLNILIVERKGDIKYFNRKENSVQKIAHLDVYHEALHVKGVNIEMGLMGIKADPHYSQSHWVYVYYSPIDSSVDRLSRFKFEDGVFDLPSEQVILEVPTRREICCHTGGSIAFDAEDNLYLSVGDNTTPFDEKNPETGKAYPINTHGFAPLDDRPGFEHFDDRRAAGNTNDLRGKILRIHVNKDGSYQTPEGNLFPEGTPKTRPEIYVMGDRNPYRIFFDTHKGYLYWGEVGPDASHDSLETRGPRGYDEINQAKEAGNYGWPYFVGDNYAYHQYDYATGTSGPLFDPENLINDSRNNTGLKKLPPPNPAFIWYPYAKSPDFPILGSGSRCAMAGPVYYTADYPKDTRFPEYYNEKLFIYDWARDWIMAVTMNKEGDLQTIEPFMPHTKFYGLIDVIAGPKGNLYTLEYGKGYFDKNPHAALSVIQYNGGNRPPISKITADKTSGLLPLKVQFSASKSKDPDGDKLTYSWDFGDGSSEKSQQSEIMHNYQKAGVYLASVSVDDGNGGSAMSENVRIYAGNSKPQVKVKTSGNTTFYFPGKSVSYKVAIKDNEDRKIDTSNVFVKIDYLKSPDKAALSFNQRNKIQAGKSLMESADCQTCHKVNKKSLGPSFMDVALRYKKESSKAVNFLSHKIINGGSGNWGEIAMAAHPGLSVSDAKTIVHWILSLADDKKTSSAPLQDTFIPNEKFKINHQGVLLISATYTDQGLDSTVPALTGNGWLALQAPVLQAIDADKSKGFSETKFKNQVIQVTDKDNAWLLFPKINLKDISAIKIAYGLKQKTGNGWIVEIHQDKPKGALLGKTIIGKGKPTMKLLHGNIPITGLRDDTKHDLYFVFQKIDTNEEHVLGVKRLRFEGLP